MPLAFGQIIMADGQMINARVLTSTGRAVTEERWTSIVGNSRRIDEAAPDSMRKQVSR